MMGTGKTKTFDSEKIRQQTFDDPALKDSDFQRILETCRSYTLTSVERMYSLHSAVKYVINAGIPGSFIECGVWQGGSCMNIALTLLNSGVTDRDIYLYDTFEGMTPPGSDDIDILGRSATALLQSPAFSGETKCNAALNSVKANMVLTNYPAERIHYISGRVEETIPATAPNAIALLRLDTDWYESTRHELRELYPRLKVGGILIIDDYGHWQGCRKATDEFLVTLQPKAYLHRIDYSGRLLIKR